MKKKTSASFLKRDWTCFITSPKPDEETPRKIRTSGNVFTLLTERQNH